LAFGNLLRGGVQFLLTQSYIQLLYTKNIHFKKKTKNIKY